MRGLLPSFRALILRGELVLSLKVIFHGRLLVSLKVIFHGGLLPGLGAGGLQKASHCWGMVKAPPHRGRLPRFEALGGLLIFKASPCPCGGLLVSFEVSLQGWALTSFKTGPCETGGLLVSLKAISYGGLLVIPYGGLLVISYGGL